MGQIVIINEQHTLMDEQRELLEKNGIWGRMDVPKDGIKRAAMKRWRDKLVNAIHDGEDVIFASPVPALLLAVAYAAGKTNGEVTRPGRVGVFHNDHREKKELPNGKMIYTIAKTGWVIEYA